MAKKPFGSTWCEPNDEVDGINRGSEWTPYSDNLSIYDLNKIVANIKYLKKAVDYGSDDFVGNTAIEFAQVEREKTKNLFDRSDFLIGGFYSSVDGTWHNNTQSVVGDYGRYLTHRGYISVQPGKDIVASCKSSVSSPSHLIFYRDRVFVGAVASASGRVPDNANQVVINFINLNGALTPDDISDIQLEYGTSATDYVPYYGGVVHEVELLDVDTKYSIAGAIDISGSTLTTLQEYYDLFHTALDKTFICVIGDLEETNFRNLVGNPPGFGNYTHCLIKNVIDGYHRARSYDTFTTFKLTALTAHSNKVAVGYIFMNDYTQIVFTGWTVYGG